MEQGGVGAMKPTQFGLQRGTRRDNSFSLHVVTDCLYLRSQVVCGLSGSQDQPPPFGELGG
jgi:hypothetical protein